MTNLAPEDVGDFLDEEGGAELLCGKMPDGTCTNAGTEHCDFVCPYRREE